MYSLLTITLKQNCIKPREVDYDGIFLQCSWNNNTLLKKKTTQENTFACLMFY